MIRFSSERMETPSEVFNLDLICLDFPFSSIFGYPALANFGFNKD